MNKLKKTIAGFVGVAFALSLVATSPASAATTAEMIASLQAQLAALMGTQTSASYTFTRDLTNGATGADVTALQNWLIGKGFSIPAGATGYFGTQTQAAVSAYQATKGLPSAGYFGPLTRAAVAADSSVMTGGNTGSTDTGSTTSLSGSYGEISDVNELSQYNDEEVGEGEDDVKVVGFEVEASNDGDVALRSVKIALDPTGNTGSDHLDDYVSEVKVWMGSKEVGSADVDEFKQGSDDVYTKTINLKNSVVKSDETEKFYVTVSAQNNFDSSDISEDSWTVDVENIRFEDGSGVVTTDDSTGDLDSGFDVPVDFVSFSTAADTELKFSKASDSPEEDVVVIDTSDTTDDVSLLKGKIKLEGTSDVLLDELPVTFTVTGATDVDQVTGSVKLIIDGEEYTETVSTSAASATVTFDNLDLTIDAGSTIEFEVLADIEGTDGGTDEGDTIKAEVTSTNRDYVDAENEEGDQLDDSSEKSGTVLGKEQELRTEGIKVALLSTSASSNNNDGADTGTFTIKYKVTAVGDAVYVASLAANAVTYSVYDSTGTATTAGTITATIKNETDTSKTSVGNYMIEEDDSESFTLTVTVPNGTGDGSDQYYVALTGVKWDLSDDTSPSDTYSSNLDEFQTNTVYLDNQ